MTYFQNPIGIQFVGREVICLSWNLSKVIGGKFGTDWQYSRREVTFSASPLKQEAPVKQVKTGERFELETI